MKGINGIVVGRCRRCGGWTMWIDPSSPNALKWWRQCERSGDSVSMENVVDVKPRCQDGDKKPSKRTCGPGPQGELVLVQP